MTAVAERCRNASPISIHRFGSNFILCYSGAHFFKAIKPSVAVLMAAADFAAYLNENGQLSSRVVEWGF